MSNIYENTRHDAYSHYARMIIQKYDDEVLEKHPNRERIVKHLDQLISPHAVIPISIDTSVGIIGAGVGGLYTAMMLESLDIPCTIIEGSRRIGGRLFTYRFDDQPGSHQYYDLGAMRFPQSNFMQRVTNLFDLLKIRRIPYYFDAKEKNSYLYYNGVRARATPPPASDTFLPQKVGVSKAYSDAGADKIVKDAISPFVEALNDDLKNGTTTGWTKVMLPKDMYSARAYLSTPNSGYSPSPDLNIAAPLPSNVVNWLETFGGSSSSFDRSLTEMVLSSMSFATGQDPEWYCIEGGSSVLATTMKNYLKSTKIEFGQRVNGIASSRLRTGVTVNVQGRQPTTYSHVISTVPLPCLRLMDLSGADLSPLQNNALRALQYGPSIKIGIQFSSAWWTHGRDKDGNPIRITGGQSYTDRPVRTVVYPSYGLNEKGSAVLMASYCRSEDAIRLGALVAATNDAVVDRDDPLATVVLRDLAAVHNVEFSYLYDICKGLHGWDWTRSEWTMGAFAYFGPGSFEDLYQSMTTPAANKRLHFAGEAISTRHAWVAGALDSAWRAVWELLMTSATWGTPANRAKFLKLWGKNADWIIPPGHGHVPVKGHDDSLADNLLYRHLAVTESLLDSDE